MMSSDIYLILQEAANFKPGDIVIPEVVGGRKFWGWNNAYNREMIEMYAGKLCVVREVKGDIGIELYQGGQPYSFRWPWYALKKLSGVRQLDGSTVEVV